MGVCLIAYGPYPIKIKRLLSNMQCRMSKKHHGSILSLDRQFGGDGHRGSPEGHTLFEFRMLGFA